jgi:hypothetical protein
MMFQVLGEEDRCVYVGRDCDRWKSRSPRPGSGCDTKENWGMQLALQRRCPFGVYGRPQVKTTLSLSL